MTLHGRLGGMTGVLALALVVGSSGAVSGEGSGGTSQGTSQGWARGPALGAVEVPEDEGAQEAQPGEAAEAPVKQIKMFAENWKWSPSLIRVPAGTRLSIEIENVDSPHRFELKKLGIKVALPEGKKTLVEFLADKPGTYRWRCSRPCGNGCAKMIGKLIVEKPSEP